jgi:hypothetical protein
MQILDLPDEGKELLQWYIESWNGKKVKKKI